MAIPNDVLVLKTFEPLPIAMDPVPSDTASFPIAIASLAVAPSFFQFVLSGVFLSSEFTEK